jgi:hypothetical protein
VKKVLQVVIVGFILVSIFILALEAEHKESVNEETDISYNELNRGWKVEVYHGNY